MNKKILFISNMYPSKLAPYFGTFVEKNYNMLTKEYEVEKIVLLSSTSKRDKTKKYFIFFMEIFKKVLKNEYSMIYIHFPSFSYIPLFFIKNNNTKKIVTNLHGSDLVSSKPLNKFLNKIFTISSLKRSIKVIVPSQYFKDLLEETYNINKDKIFVSPSGGINSKIFYPREQCFPKNKVIGYCGRLTKEKGIIELIEAFKEVYSKNQDLKLYIIGSGGLQKEIETITKDIPKEVIFIFGGKSQTEISEILNEVDIFVFPSWQESLGLVGLEAMSKKCLVIASEIPGIESYLVDGYNGKLFKHRNSQSLVNCLNEVLNLSENERRQLIDNGYETSKHYSSNIVEKLLLKELNEKIN